MTMPDPSMLSDDDQAKLKSGDYVYDSVFGVTPKDVPTLLRLRDEENRQAVKSASQSVETPAQLAKAAKKND